VTIKKFYRFQQCPLWDFTQQFQQFQQIESFEMRFTRSVAGDIRRELNVLNLGEKVKEYQQNYSAYIVT
jgi:hypothetical protein